MKPDRWIPWLAAIVLIPRLTVATAAWIQFRPSITIESPVVRLGDVADIRDADSDMVDRLSSILLAPAPQAGRQIWLDFEDIRARLLASGMNLRDVDFSGANAVLIATVDRPEPKPRPTPPRKLTPATHPRPVGKFVVAAKYTLPKGHILQSDDLVMRRSATTQAMFLRAEDVIGRETTHSLRPDAPVLKSAIRDIPLVRSNDMVTVYSRAGGICVKRVFKARSSGAKGEIITLTTSDNRDKIQARVTGYQEAEVLDSTPRRTNRYVDETGTIQFNSTRSSTPTGNGMIPANLPPGRFIRDPRRGGP